MKEWIVRCKVTGEASFIVDANSEMEAREKVLALREKDVEDIYVEPETVLEAVANE